MSTKTIVTAALVTTTVVLVGVVFFAKKRNKKKSEPVLQLGFTPEAPVRASGEVLPETDAKVVGVQLHTAEGVSDALPGNVYELLHRSRPHPDQTPEPQGTKHPVPEFFKATVNRTRTQGAHP